MTSRVFSWSGLVVKTSGKDIFSNFTHALTTQAELPSAKMHGDKSHPSLTIRDFPDHATLREKSVTTGLVGQAWGVPLFDSM